MHPPFLFRFGYCTPDQFTENEQHGWDDESSGAFFVLADSTEDALASGAAIADAYVKHLFDEAEATQPQSWKEAQFASWIETDPEVISSIETQNRLPRVKVGEMPDFDGWQPY